MKPIAVVTPWFAPDLTGGAEQQAFQIATRLASRGHSLEVLTTCNRSFDSDWAVNHYENGVANEFGLTIRRFPVDARKSVAFDQVNAELLAVPAGTLKRGVCPVSVEQSETFVKENIKSSALIEFLRRSERDYQAIIFLPYMFGPITEGIPVVAKRAWLQPCLHDEPQAYFPQVAALFRAANHILFNSAGEMELALQLYGPGIFNRSSVVGEGIERAVYPAAELLAALPSELRTKRFVLYLGRRDRTKNVHQLTAAFLRFRQKCSTSQLQLVLAGNGPESVYSSDSVTEMGFVTAELKAALLMNCVALVQPSTNESFSRVVMEAWAMGRPVAVNGACLATATAVNEAQGGWTPISIEDWSAWFEQLDSVSPDTLDQLGQQGYEYAKSNADWDKVIDRYEILLDSKAARTYSSKSISDRKLRAIHQVLPDFVFGDAISNQALAIRDQIRALGYQSKIFCKRRDERSPDVAALLDESKPETGAALIYHYGIGSDLTAAVLAHQGPKALVYHNITPASYFQAYRPGFAWMLDVGRVSLKRLGRYFCHSVADSAYNASELAASGFKSPQVLPIIIDPDRWNIEPNEELLNRLQDGRTNILFTGRLAPNKKQDQLLRAFAAYRKLDPTARLIIVGQSLSFDPYAQYISELTHELELAECVEQVGQIDEAQLLAYYQTTHLYWSASEHEGFGAPLIEAMWFGIPVLALNESAVGETLGDAGVLYEKSEPLDHVALRAYELIYDEQRRREVIVRQRVRRVDFLPAAITPRIINLCEALEDEVTESRSEPSLKKMQH